jgi:hypothetical protein
MLMLQWIWFGGVVAMLALCGAVYVACVRFPAPERIPLPVVVEARLANRTFIPKHVFQSATTQEEIDRRADWQTAQQSWKATSAHGYKYFFYDDATARTFIEANFSPRTLKAYDACTAPILKRYVWRYCAIFQYGGIYADLTTRCVNVDGIYMLTRPQSFLVVAVNLKNQLSADCFAAPAQSPVLEGVLELVVTRLLEQPLPDASRLTRRQVSQLVGDQAFTEAVEDYLRRLVLPTFRNRARYQNYQHHVLHVYSPAALQQWVTT